MTCLEIFNMNINDFFELPEFESLDTFLNEELERTAGPKLIEKMNYLFDSEYNVRDWYFSNIIALGNKRPYDFCKMGKQQDVKDILCRIQYGVYS